jgi:hypothetical protein
MPFIMKIQPFLFAGEKLRAVIDSSDIVYKAIKSAIPSKSFSGCYKVLYLSVLPEFSEFFIFIF